MASPFPKSASSPGEGHVVVRLLPHSISALSTITYQYPLKLISPSPSAHQKSVLVFLLTYGGGLVGGDQVNLKIDVQSKSKLSIATQGHTKVFKSPSRDVVTRQTLDVTIGTGAAVCLLPDPVQPFGESVYEQSQIFTLAEGASICLLDWVSCGRTARGENWDFWSWSGRNEIWSRSNGDDKSRLLLRDNVSLEGDVSSQRNMLLRDRMHGNGLFGTLILRGPLMESLAEFFLLEFAALPRIGARDFRSQEAREIDGQKSVSERESWRSLRLKQEKQDGVLWSVAKVRGCTIVKFGANTVEAGRHWIGSMIKEEKSVCETFGEDSIMCIR
jgi:urease accessory protein